MKNPHPIFALLLWTLLILIGAAIVYAILWYLWFRGHYIYNLWLAGRWPAIWE